MTKTWIVTNDWQIPFEDEPVVNMVLDFIKALKPDGIVLNGDITDCFAISSHRKDSRAIKKATLEHEREKLHGYLERLERIPEKWYLGGNHEERFYRHIQDHAPELGVVEGVDFPTIFKLGKFGFKWRDYGEYVNLGKLTVTHGDIVRKQSAYSAKAHFDKFGCSVLHGHTHRLGAYYHTNLSGAHGAWENGCLCHLDGLGYAKHPDWQQGFAVVHVGSNGAFNVQQPVIIDRKRFWYGKELIER